MFKTLSRKLRSLPILQSGPLDLSKIENASPEAATFAAGFIEAQYAANSEVTNWDCLAIAHRLINPPGQPDASTWAVFIGPDGQRQAIEAIRQLVNRAKFTGEKS